VVLDAQAGHEHSVAEVIGADFDRLMQLRLEVKARIQRR
jgi:hypothetical protein